MMSGVLAFASDSAILLVPSSVVLSYLLLFKLSFAESSVRKLEDKLVQHRIEWRLFFVPVDLSDIHGRREMPSAFSWYLCVADSTLPSKGTAHRANRTAEKVP